MRSTTLKYAASFAALAIAAPFAFQYFGRGPAQQGYAKAPVVKAEPKKDVVIAAASPRADERPRQVQAIPVAPSDGSTGAASVPGMVVQAAPPATASARVREAAPAPAAPVAAPAAPTSGGMHGMFNVSPPPPTAPTAAPAARPADGDAADKATAEAKAKAETEQKSLGDARAKARAMADTKLAEVQRAAPQRSQGIIAQGPNLGVDNTNPTTRFSLGGAPAPQAAAPAAKKMGTAPATDARMAAAAPSVQPYILPHPMPRPEPMPHVQQNRDQFEKFEPNPVKATAQEPVSTFSLDVDTASYAMVRRQLNQGRLPNADTVRIEEMINYFPYDYARPESRDTPFRANVTVVPSPWTPNAQLVHIGVKGYALSDANRPRANLVFLVDISGSMSPTDRLPLLKTAFRMLVDQLKPDDTIGIVTYASGSDIRLKPTKVSDRSAILSAIDSLNAGGSTHGAQGLQDAYRLAEQHFDKTGVNRIILGTDGDFNVGITNREELKTFIERKRATGIFLSILGVGQGNYNDALMQSLARNGNGVAAYIDTLAEARKVLVDEATSSIFPIAKDVKVQIEFNPAVVRDYRLVGYEKRILRREDFNNDKVDAGDIGSGHTVTAIYEITPVGAPPRIDDLRYAKPATTPEPRPQAVAADAELAFLKLRYKRPNEDTSQLVTVPLTPAMVKPRLADAPADVRFSIAVAGFAQVLKGSAHTTSTSLDEIIALANDARGPDPFGWRAEFVNLVRLAKSLRP